MSFFRKYDTTTPRFPRCIEKMMRIACSGEESKQRLDVRHGMGGDGPRFSTQEKTQVFLGNKSGKPQFWKFFSHQIHWFSVRDRPPLKGLPDFMVSPLTNSRGWTRSKLTADKQTCELVPRNHHLNHLTVRSSNYKYIYIYINLSLNYLILNGLQRSRGQCFLTSPYGKSPPPRLNCGPGPPSARWPA